MPVFDARDLLEFPKGDNDTSTVFGGVQFNLTTLNFWNYTYYSNGTLSNGSNCFLTFEPYQPKLLYSNGTFINTTSCYSPLKPIGARAGVGMGFAAAFGIALVLSLVALSKHGKLYLPPSKRFWPIGRRWQWYWALLACAMALIALITNVDVDRYYLPELPLVLNCFFWFLLQLCTMAVVWEAVRHWGSWMERQFIDPNPFVLPQDDRRGMFEFFLPLVFYLWWWLNFFMVVPRNWGAIELQRDPDQTRLRAAPSATDVRFKAAVFFLVLCWVTTVVSLRHSIKHYRERTGGFINRTVGAIRFTPFRFVLLLPLSGAIVAYQGLAAWDFQYSPLNLNGNVLAIYLGGYAPSLLILFIQVVWGFATPNEDRELIRQRRMRGEALDREMGVVKKPAWWRRINAEHYPGESMRDRITRNVREIGGGRATARNIDRELDTRATETEATVGTNIEMNDMRHTQSGQPLPAGFDAARSARPAATPYGGKSDRRRTERTMAVAAGLLFPNATPSPSAAEREAELGLDGPPPPYPEERGRTPSIASESTLMPVATRTNSTGTLNSISNARPQQVRSMLDI